MTHMKRNIGILILLIAPVLTGARGLPASAQPESRPSDVVHQKLSALGGGRDSRGQSARETEAFPLEEALPPTENQFELLEELFGDSVALEAVHYWVSPLGDDFHYVYVIEENIFFPPSYQHYANSVLAHEFTHVWQQTVGGWSFDEVLRSVLNNQDCEQGKGCTYSGNAYDFYLDVRYTFDDYGMEQQAELMESYYLMAYEGRFNDHCLNCEELGLDASVEIAENLLRQSINEHLGQD